jgi:hypothetical protein
MLVLCFFIGGGGRVSAVARKYPKMGNITELSNPISGKFPLDDSSFVSAPLLRLDVS